MDSEIDDSQIQPPMNQVIEERIIKPNGDEIVKKYTLGKFLGKGGFAKCYEFQCLNNKKIHAVKIVSKANLNKSSAKQKLKSEIKIHKSLFHKHIVKFEHVFEDNENVYILLELCKSKTLSDLMKKRKIISEFECRYFITQILKAINFMHKNKIVHRDLKLGNLFLNDDMEIKIGDFGLATIIEFPGQLRYTVCGTPNYIAPEILEGKNSGHSFEVDYWALGVIVYTLLVGKPPYETEDVKETYKRIKANEYTYPPHVYVSDDAKDFISNLLVIDPTKRLKVDEMKNHPFIRSYPSPKTVPTSIIKNPISSSLMIANMIENKKLTNLETASMLIEKDKYELYLKRMKEFAISNIVQVKNEVVNERFLITKKEFLTYVEHNNDKEYLINRANSLNYRKRCDPIINMKFLTNFNEISFSKEYNPTLVRKKPIEKEDLILGKEENKVITVIEQLIDIDNAIGIAYYTNTNQVGIIFNDETTIFTFINETKTNDNLFYIYDKLFIFDLAKKDKNKYLKLKEMNYLQTLDFKSDNRNGVSEIILNKIKLLSQLLNHCYSNITQSSSKNNNSNIKKVNYPILHYKSELAYFIRFNNLFTQMIFYDNSRLMIGNYLYPQVLYWDKEGKISNHNIHQINKSKNKNMLKRYEHYKKIFYDKLEQRFNHKVSLKEDLRQNEEDEITTTNILDAELNEIAIDADSKTDLNKTL